MRERRNARCAEVKHDHIGYAKVYAYRLPDESGILSILAKRVCEGGKIMGFFDQASSGQMNGVDAGELQKALTAGYGTDSAQFTGGRALIPEDLESETINVVSLLKEDCKVMNTVKKTPVRSTVHEINTRTEHRKAGTRLLLIRRLKESHTT